MKQLEVKAAFLRWTPGTVAYHHVEHDVYVMLELSDEQWERLKVQMQEEEALHDCGVAEA